MRLSRARRVAGFVTGAMLLAAAASAQTTQTAPGRWRLGAFTGAYVPFSPLIRAADSNHTRLAAAPAFALEAQYLASSYLAAYANGLLAFSRIRLGSTIRPGVVGPSDHVVLAAGTAGLILTTDLLGENLQPTLRLGGGLKAYFFDLAGAENQVRPAADLGVGFRGIGIGGVEVSTELRYLPGSFDQDRLPTRGIAPQAQRQTDLLFSIGIAIRPG